jgi:hypothetical protein
VVQNEEPPAAAENEQPPVLEPIQPLPVADQLTAVLSGISKLSETVEGLCGRVSGLEKPAKDNKKSTDEADDDSTDTEDEIAEVTPKSMRNDNELQQQVSLRLDQLSSLAELSSENFPNTRLGKRSGRTKTVHDIVVKDVEWPHFYVQRTCTEKTLMYDDMSLPEYVAGTVKAILAKEKVSPLAQIQFTQLAETMADAEDFPWPVLRQFNGLVLQDIELGRYSWFDQDVISKKKLKHVSRAQSRRAQAPQIRPRQLVDSTQRPTNVNLLCKSYNLGRCNEVSPHMSPEGLVRHSCANCLKTLQRYFGHPESQCRRRVE